MNILSYMKEFLAISEYGNYEKAAAELYSTQSTLSKHILKLEHELGVILFDRNSRNVKLSECGKILLPYARQMIQIEREYQMALSTHTRETQYIVSIGSVTNIVAYNISNIFVKFQHKYPNYHLDIAGGSPYSIYQNLLGGKYDLAFLRYTEKTIMSDLVAVPFTEDKIVAVCSKKHPLAENSSIAMKELGSERLLLFSEHTFMYDFIMDACADVGFKPNISLTVHRTENLIELASQNMGICFLMRKPALNIDNPNVAIVELDPPYKCRIDLCYVKNKKLSLQAKNFLHFVQETINHESIE